MKSNLRKLLQKLFVKLCNLKPWSGPPPPIAQPQHQNSVVTSHLPLKVSNPFVRASLTQVLPFLLEP